MMKADTAELALVGEGQSALLLKQNEVIVFVGLKVWRLDTDLAGHAEVNAEPIVAGKFEEHSFAARMRAEKFCAD